MKDGHLGKCKKCTQLDTQVNTERLKKNKKWIIKERQRCRERYHRLNYIKYSRLSDKLFPEKKKAHSAAQHMKKIKGGERHHWSYCEEHWKDTITLSISNHRRIHRHIIYDPERKMYRRIDTNELLDTKQEHLNYISNFFA